MRKIIIMALMAIAILPTHAENTATGDKTTKSEKNDTVRIRYIHRLTEDDARIFESTLEKTVIYVNDQVTTHLIMPENIKLVDISTDKLVGNQCADNIVRLKPKSMLMDNELAGTVTIIGERHIAQFTVYYTKAPKRAHSVYTVGQEDIRGYTNPEVSMTLGDMSRLCWSIFTSRRKCFRVHSKQYGIRAQVNNIYTVGDFVTDNGVLYSNRSYIKSSLRYRDLGSWNCYADFEDDWGDFQGVGYDDVKCLMWLDETDYLKSEDGSLIEGLDFLIDESGNVYEYDYNSDAAFLVEGMTAYTEAGTPKHFDFDQAEPVTII